MSRHAAEPQHGSRAVRDTPFKNETEKAYLNGVGRNSKPTNKLSWNRFAEGRSHGRSFFNGVSPTAIGSVPRTLWAGRGITLCRVSGSRSAAAAAAAAAHAGGNGANDVGLMPPPAARRHGPATATAETRLQAGANGGV